MGTRRVLLILLCLLAIIGVAVLDGTTGTDLNFSAFYLLPVGVLLWEAGVFWAAAGAIISNLAWFIADQTLSAKGYPHYFIPVWNVAIRFLVFAVLIGVLHRLKISLQNERLLARRDPLTRIFNSRAFLEICSMEIQRSRRYGRPLSIAYIDCDNFKMVNDRHGHHVGDELLRTIAQAMRRSIRGSDFVARLAGDEFAILFPETGAAALEDTVQVIRDRLLREMQKRNWPVTFSIGVASFPQPPDSVDDMIRIADSFMYAAKNSGKNKIHFSPALSSRTPQEGQKT